MIFKSHYKSCYINCAIVDDLVDGWTLVCARVARSLGAVLQKIIWDITPQIEATADGNAFWRI